MVKEKIEETSARLLEIVRQLTAELRTGRRTLSVTLDSALDRDLGFDSLSRVELVLRVERTFRVSLPEQAFASAGTPRDLLRAVLSADTTRPAAVPLEIMPVARGEVEAAPHSAQTLLEVLHWHVAAQPDRPHVYLYGAGEEPEPITYTVLHDGARAIAAGLAGRGLQPGRTVAIMLPTGRDYLFCFIGILLAGGIPVPVYPPARLSQIEDHLRRHAGILANAQVSLLITVPEAQPVARLLKSQVPELRSVVTPEAVLASVADFTGPSAQAEDVALLQYTSGSTGHPKGVVLTHADLLANVRAMGETIRANSTDVFVSWLPLYHDMGLIGAWLGSLYYACPLVLMSPLAFLSHPQRWLWAIHRHRGTLSAAPNFGYEFCLNKIADSELKGLDLSSWRMAFNGAEPVSPHTVRNFSKRFGHYGFRHAAMAPVYGLAEAAVGLAFPPPDRGPLIDHIQREPFVGSGRAIPAETDDTHTLEFIACGQPLPGYQIRIVDHPGGRELPEREEGQLQFRGPSATSGYFRNPEATAGLFDGEWLDSGDLAYIAGGDVYLTSRVKDVIIRGGRNIYPYEVEEGVGNIDGVRKGCVAVFGSTDPRSGTERVVVLAETRETDPQVLDALQTRVSTLTTDLLGIPADDVVLAPPHTILKTSSGKIRRAASRELYEQGRIGKGPRAVWWQFARLILAGLWPGWRRLWRAASEFGYAAYAHLVFWLMAPTAWLLVTLLPRRHWRWAVMHRAARLLLHLVRVPLLVKGMERLPQKACVVVANHASYIDGIVLIAALPSPFSFLAKAELGQRFVSGVFLRRIGAEFVDRFDQQKGVADARRTVQAAQAGHSLLVFPEGTFTRMPGLLPFHMGAFAAAGEAGLPVVPVTLRGTRSVLRGDSWFPRRGAVALIVGATILPEGSDWKAAMKLRNATRAEILRHLGEPDLAPGTPPL